MSFGIRKQIIAFLFFHLNLLEIEKTDESQTALSLWLYCKYLKRSWDKITVLKKGYTRMYYFIEKKICTYLEKKSCYSEQRLSIDFIVSGFFNKKKTLLINVKIRTMANFSVYLTDEAFWCNHRSETVKTGQNYIHFCSSGC